MINEGNWIEYCGEPFPHWIADDFLEHPYRTTSDMALRFLDPSWIEYKSEDQVKRTCNNWNVFPFTTYRLLSELLSPRFCAFLSERVGCELFPDYGLHGGGWHASNNSGVLRPHLDYSCHPKLFMQRKLNLIIYLTHNMEEEWGGHLGLWKGTPIEPQVLVREIQPKFNRAVLFDTTKNSWHGMSRPLSMPEGVWRLSLAVYYLCKPDASMNRNRKKAQFHDAA